MKPSRFALLLAGGAALALTGCSSAVTGGTGIFVENGHVRAIVQMCPDVTASEVRLGEKGASSWFDTSIRFDGAVSATTDLGELEDFLTVVGKQEMTLQSNASSGVGGWVWFDAADIRSLNDGDILSYSWSARGSQIFDQAGFESEATLYCH